MSYSQTFNDKGSSYPSSTLFKTRLLQRGSFETKETMSWLHQVGECLHRLTISEAICVNTGPRSPKSVCQFCLEKRAEGMGNNFQLLEQDLPPSSPSCRGLVDYWGYPGTSTGRKSYRSEQEMSLPR